MEQYEFLKSEKMKIEQLIFLLLVSLLIVIRESLGERKRIDLSKVWNSVWHKAGWAMRFCVFSAVMLIVKHDPTWQRLLYGIGLALLFWPIYNIGCNVGAKRKWYYVNNNGIDWLIRKCLPFIDFDKK